MTSTPPPLGSLRLAVPDPGFRLTIEQRAHIRPGFDVNALERLLASVETEARPRILEAFLPADPAVGGIVLLNFGDDHVLNAMLDEVWAPIWEARPREAFEDDPDVRWPGRELARRRLEARGYRGEP